MSPAKRSTFLTRAKLALCVVSLLLTGFILICVLELQPSVSMDVPSGKSPTDQPRSSPSARKPVIYSTDDDREPRDSLLSPRLIYFPRITKTGSTAVYKIVRRWTSMFLNHKMIAVSEEFLNRHRSLHPHIPLDLGQSMSEMKHMIFERDEHRELKPFRELGGYFKSNFDNDNRYPNIHPWTEFNDGCAHSGGNELIAQRNQGEFRPIWKQEWAKLVFALRDFEEVFLRLLIGQLPRGSHGSIDNSTSDVVSLRGLFRQVWIAGESNLTVNASSNSNDNRNHSGVWDGWFDIPCFMHAHWPHLRSNQEWMLQQIRRDFLSGVLNQIISFRNPSERTTSLFRFLRLPERKPLRSQMILVGTHNLSLPECVADLERSLRKSYPLSRGQRRNVSIDECNLAVNLQVKWLCGSLENWECPCSDELSQSQVLRTAQSVESDFDAVLMLRQLSSDLSKLRKKMFVDLNRDGFEFPRSVDLLPSILPGEGGHANVHRVRLSEEERRAERVLSQVNAKEFMFLSRMSHYWDSFTQRNSK